MLLLTNFIYCYCLHINCGDLWW